MPNKDKTGPKGKGPMTGRQFGNCEGAKENNCPKGQGKRMGCGRGRKMQSE